MPVRLPIDEILPQVVANLHRAEVKSLVIEAPPGAGKTTRLPPAFLDGPSSTRSIFVSEPRRVAARLSARRVAEERNCTLGKEVGYQVRFEDKTSSETRLTYLTEGLLLSRLLENPGFAAGKIIFLDEVHERSADLDAILSLLKQAQDRDVDFKLVVMSATLNANELVSYLGPRTVRLTSEGRSYPVDFVFAPRPDDRPLPIQVRSAVRSALAREGDILVFLPGAAEIRACAEALQALGGIGIATMHGDLPLSEQIKVVSPQTEGRRIVLSTNIAESSLTIPGITTVIDSGLARTSVYDPWTAVSRLETLPISQARALQRAGRAGRLAAGQAIFLYTKGQFETRPEQDTPELLRTDLSYFLLKFLALQDAGGPAISDLRFLSEPSPSSWEKSRQHLRQLGALQEERISDLGRQMVLFPLPPRLSRCLVEAARLDQLARTCIAAALLSERDLLQSSRRFPDSSDVQATDSDLDERVELLSELANSHFDRRFAREFDLDPNIARQVDQIARSLYGQARKHLVEQAHGVASDLYQQAATEAAGPPLAKVFLPGFVDRVAQRRAQGRDLILQTGTQATLSERSGVDAPLLLSFSIDAPGGRSRKPVVRMAARLDPDWLLELEDDGLSASDEYIFDPEKRRVELLSRLTFGKIVLDESRTLAPNNESSRKVLSEQILAQGAALYDTGGLILEARLRLALLLKHMPEKLGQSSEEDRARLSTLASSPPELDREILLSVLRDSVTMDKLDESAISGGLYAALGSEVVQLLDSELPLSIRLKGGLSVKVHYEESRPPWLEARLQNFFSMTETPSLCGGRLQVQIHLLAPNHRAVQVTSDLAGFWERHYPDLRKQLMRRYPKHLWPEDGRSAQPPTPGRIR